MVAGVSELAVNLKQGSCTFNGLINGGAGLWDVDVGVGVATVTEDDVDFGVFFLGSLALMMILPRVSASSISSSFAASPNFSCLL